MISVNRQQLAKFLPDNESIRVFEELIRTANTAEKNAGSVSVVPADVTASSTTLVDAGLDLPVAANYTYCFEFCGAYSAASTGTGSRWVIDGPAASLLAYSSEWSLTTTSRTVNHLDAYNLPASANASSANTGGNVVKIEGLIRPSVNGVLSLKFASSAASAITLKAGSFARFTRLT